MEKEPLLSLSYLAIICPTASEPCLCSGEMACEASASWPLKRALTLSVVCVCVCAFSFLFEILEDQSCCAFDENLRTMYQRSLKLPYP